MVYCIPPPPGSSRCVTWGHSPVLATHPTWVRAPTAPRTPRPRREQLPRTPARRGGHPPATALSPRRSGFPLSAGRQGPQRRRAAAGPRRPGDPRSCARAAVSAPIPGDCPPGPSALSGAPGRAWREVRGRGQRGEKREKRGQPRERAGRGRGEVSAPSREG